MPPQETGKQRAARIPLDYYKHSDPLERWKLRLGGLALVATLAWVGVQSVLSEQRDFQASRGAVAAVHQTWDSQCSACHVDFTPISSHSWAPFFLRDPNESSTRCQACHAGPDHHSSQKPDLTCASCHRDHRGHEASLVNLPDSDCTQCHKDLGTHMDLNKAWHLQHGGQEFAKKVTRFAENTHPPFRSIATDPGKLKFSHRRHLALGMRLETDKEKGDPIKFVGDIQDVAFRKRHEKQQPGAKDTDPVQLQCASCHQLDPGDFGLPGQRNAGAYMVPITYENQCQACHPLTVDRKVFSDPKAGYLAIPHRWQPKEIHEFLDNFFTAQAARGQADFPEKKVLRPLPGKTLDLLEPKVRDEINKKRENVEKELYIGRKACALCHEFTGNIPVAIKSRHPSDLGVVPTDVPQVWFQHAKFNHTAHRAVECANCHTGAETSTASSDVLIPGLDNCVQCHAPSSKIGTPSARFNCTECHGYHNGAHSIQGVGAAKRNPEKGRSVDAFLHGK